MKCIRQFFIPIIALMFAMYLPQAFGSGFAIVEQSGRSMGMANANSATVDDDPSAIFFNPAGIGWIEGTEIAVNAHVVSPRIQFSDRNSTPVGGGEGGDPGENAYVANVFASHKLNDKVSLGIAVFSPFGLATEYDDNWIGRFAGIKSEVMTVNVNPTLAVKPNEKFSLGVGVSGQYVEAELTQALSPQVPGAIGKIKGDDYAFGFNLGAQYALTDTTMAGVSFRSKVDHELEGDASFSGVLPKSDVTADLETPEIVSFGLSQEICKSWKVFGDVTWTGWSTFEELRVNYKDGRPDTVNFENWDDTWRFSLGTEYAFSEKWVGRMGVAWDESPVPDAEHRTVRIPCSDRTWLAFGLGYQPSEQWLIDAGFMWVWFEDVRINNEYAPGARVVGDFEGEAQVYSLQARYKF